MTQNERIEMMKTILKLHEIDMSVSACGCCNSPDIKFKYKGQFILDSSGCNFTTEETLEEENDN